jgi:hypothetical protein
MPVLVPNAPIGRRNLVAPQLRPDGVIDQLAQIMRNLDIGTQTEEYMAGIARLALLAPDPAITKVRDGADTIIQRNALSAPGLIRALLALCMTDLDIGQRKVVPVEQLGHLGRRRQGFGLGAAIVRGLGAQTLDSRLEPVERDEVRVHGCRHQAIRYAKTKEGSFQRGDFNRR